MTFTLTETRLEVFVPTRLVNPLNTREFWAKRAKRARAQRDAVALAVWSALRVPQPGVRQFVWTILAKPSDPKRITLTAHTVRPMDGDGLQAACKAIRDGLMDAGLIQDDGPRSGHTFAYHQVCDGTRGVTICVERILPCYGCDLEIQREHNPGCPAREA